MKSVQACALALLALGASSPAGADRFCAVAGTSSLWAEFVDAREKNAEPVLPDFSYAGYKYSASPIPTVDGPTFAVTDYGARPDDEAFDDAGIQAAIDAASERGGGVVQFPQGRFLVSPTTDPNASINISASRVVLRGAGSQAGGTEIHMASMKPGSTMFKIAPRTTSSATLATIVDEAPRESFSVHVDRASALRVGQRVVIRHQNRSYNPLYWPPLPLDPEWTRVYDGGPPFHEVHTVAEIEGSRVKFEEPLHFTIRSTNVPFRLTAIELLEDVGIEDIQFSGAWDAYPEDFVHHKDAIHDTGWSILSMTRVVNGWVRRCEFRNVNQGIHTDTAVAFTFDGIRFTGKKGHTSISTRRGYGVLVKDSEDEAAHHHGPGVGYQGVGTVYLRHQMQRNQRINSHGGNPYATLLDSVTGGVLDGNGGPFENYPHHAHHFVFWNFQHRSSGSKTYDFWNIERRNSSTFALPIFAGLTFDRSVRFQDESTEVLRNESFGTAVTPASLFEAQLQWRLCRE